MPLDDTPDQTLPAKPKVGRPTTYDPKYIDIIVELGAQGKSQAQISATIDIARSTMQRWAENNPPFASALARAKELEQAWWEDQAQDKLGDRNFNTSLWLGSVKSRFRAEYGDQPRTVTLEAGASLVDALDRIEQQRAIESKVIDVEHEDVSD